MKKLLDYHFPEDLKNMSLYELELLSYGIRDFLIGNISKTGGHLASNLGVVELSIALHKTFDTPDDKLVWDVGHQTYIHKILTGRAGKFETLRQMGGLSGFPKAQESQYDTFDMGHSSTSISVATGMAVSRDLSGEDYKVAAIIGDGALTGGLAYEALNNAGASRRNMMVILNDNGMSIDPNTGGVSKYLGKLRSTHGYLNMKTKVKKNVSRIPAIGPAAVLGMQHIRNSLKYAILDGVIFEELGFHYYGPVDGHNINALIETLEMAKDLKGPVFIHVITKKGKGYRSAEKTPSKYHGTGPFDPSTGLQVSKKGPLTYSQIFGQKLCQMAEKDLRIVAVSAAMLDGTGLMSFQKQFPERTFDVGIAEAHGVTFAAGMATGGYRPFVAVYSTFLQRAYDQLMEDVCLQGLPVIFAIDRAGIVGADGETHHGLFDLSYLNHMPGMTVLAPADGGDLEVMMEYAMTLNGPCAIRYPKDNTTTSDLIEPIKGSQVISKGKDLEIWAVGNMMPIACNVQENLKKRKISAGLVNVRFVKPMDETEIFRSSKRTGLLVTMEDNCLTGGFGESLSSLLKKTRGDVLSFGWPNRFIEHGSRAELMKAYGLDADGITERICDYLEGQT